MCEGLTYLPPEDVNAIFGDIAESRLGNALIRHLSCDMKTPHPNNKFLLEFRWYEIFVVGSGPDILLATSKGCSTWHTGPLWVDKTLILGEISFVVSYGTLTSNAIHAYDSSFRLL